jgi:3-deoxy-D-manno-octulosonic-acid transferase
MRFLYDIFFIIFAILYLPYFLLKGKYHRDFWQRFGIFDKSAFSYIASNRPIWLHAVSVGEMKTAEGFINKMRTLFPSSNFVISNVTQTGHNIAASIAKKKDMVIYFPLDLSFVVKKLTKLINPSLFISMETEVWPNLIAELSLKNVPVILMNGRISPTSFRNYRIIKPVIRSILEKMTLFCMRTETDAERIKELGAPADRVKVTGNMKFDITLAKDKEDAGDWPPIKNKNRWLGDSSKLMIAGSTHRGEEDKVLQSYRILKRDHPDLSLLIAPRHIERVNEISNLIERTGFNSVKISDVEKRCAGTGGNPADYGDNSIFMLDSMGHLSSFYKLATVVFMGGSFISHGGQNFIEPAAYGRPVITGPSVYNFEDAYELLTSSDAIETVHNEGELRVCLSKLLSDEDRLKGIGERAKKAILSNRGSTDRNIELIKEHLL